MHLLKDWKRLLKLWVEMTPTAIHQATRRPVLRTYNSRGSFGRLRLLWIFLCWTMLS